MQKDDRQLRGRIKKSRCYRLGGEKSGDKAEEKDRKRQDKRLMRQSGEIEN